MSLLKNHRQAIKNALVNANVLPADQIIIDRHNDEWEAIRNAVTMAKNGLCIHIAEASGRVIEQDFADMLCTVDIEIKLFAETNYQPNEITDDLGSITASPPALSAPGAWPEEEVWESMVKELHGLIIQPLGNNNNHCSYQLHLNTWAHFPNDFDYYCRVTTFSFKTVIIGNH
jgi:hypothetical protein